MSKRIAVLAPLITVALSLYGCSTFDYRYHYRPRPADVESALPGKGDVQTFVTIVGIRRADEARNLGPTVEARLRIENYGKKTVHFDPTSLSLIAGNLKEFPPPVTEPGRPIDVEPGKSAEILALFPFPGGEYPDGYDLGGLNIRWKLEVDGETLRKAVTFSRRRLYHGYDYDPYYYYYPPGFSYGLGEDEGDSN